MVSVRKQAELIIQSTLAIRERGNEAGKGSILCRFKMNICDWIWTWNKGFESRMVGLM
jgi:hypothetical protein